MRNKIQGFTKFAGGKLVAGAVLAGEKTREGIAVAKRKAKIASAKKRMDGDLLLIGEHVCDKLAAGECFDETIREIAMRIEAEKEEIRLLEEEIEEIRLWNRVGGRG